MYDFVVVSKSVERHNADKNDTCVKFTKDKTEERKHQREASGLKWKIPMEKFDLNQDKRENHCK